MVEMAWISSLVLVLGLTQVCLQIQIVSSLTCYSCVNLAANNDYLGVLQANEACAGPTFDPNGVDVQECEPVFGQTAKCEKWEGKVTGNVILLGSVEITGQVRGCALFPVDQLDGCASTTELNGAAQTALQLATALLSGEEVQGTYCSCDRDYCNAAPGLRDTGTRGTVVILLLLQGLLLYLA